MIQTALHSDAEKEQRVRPTDTLSQVFSRKAMFATVPQLANWALQPITVFVNLMTMCAVVRSTIEVIMATHSRVI